MTARPPARFRDGDTVSWIWPGSRVEVSGKIVASDEAGITGVDTDGREYTVAHGQFYPSGECPDNG